jgi:hypothetical protein
VPFDLAQYCENNFHITFVPLRIPMTYSTKFAACLAVAFSIVSAAASANAATMIGINFVGGGGPGPAGGVSLAPGSIAGVVPQANYNNVTGGSGSANNLIDNTGAATSVDLTFSGGGTYTSSGNAPAGADEALNTGFVFGTVTGTISELPFAFGTYDVYIYMENDAGGRQTTTLLNGGNARTHTSIAGNRPVRSMATPARPSRISWHRASALSPTATTRSSAA